MDFQIGTRVIDSEGFKATVRYLGPVAAAKNKNEIWLGVEWDDKSRGKHDGSCVDDEGKLHRYFECAYGAGSFVKPSKVFSGKSLNEALRERYVDLNAPAIVDEEDPKLPDAFVSTSKGNKKSIEFFGEKKIRIRQQLSNIEKVSLRSDSASYITDGLRDLIGHITELDLQDNLFSRWGEIFKIGLEISNLTTLLLHGNKMEQVTPGILESFSENTFKNLKVLALNNCNIKSWKEIQLLEPYFPSLEELYLDNNSLGDLPRELAEQEYRNAIGEEEIYEPKFVVSGFSKLRILDIGNCCLDEWSQIRSFGLLPNLQELVLDGNPLSKILSPLSGEFSKLFRISLGSIKIQSWEEIDVLDKFSNLQVLRIHQVPIFVGKGASEVRPLVIARIENLKALNGSAISSRERIDSEKTYFRSILREITNLGLDKLTSKDLIDQKLQEIHPKYLSLMAKHGQDILVSQENTSAQHNMASEMVNVTFKNLSFGSGGSLDPITKKLPKSLTINKLKMLVKQLFGLDIRLQQLSLRVYKDSPPTLLDDEESTLQYYGAMDPCEVFINEDKA